MLVAGGSVTNVGLIRASGGDGGGQQGDARVGGGDGGALGMVGGGGNGGGVVKSSEDAAVSSFSSGGAGAGGGGGGRVYLAGEYVHARSVRRRQHPEKPPLTGAVDVSGGRGTFKRHFEGGRDLGVTLAEAQYVSTFVSRMVVGIGKSNDTAAPPFPVQDRSAVRDGEDGTVVTSSHASMSVQVDPYSGGAAGSFKSLRVIGGGEDLRTGSSVPKRDRFNFHGIQQDLQKSGRYYSTLDYNMAVYIYHYILLYII